MAPRRKTAAERARVLRLGTARSVAPEREPEIGDVEDGISNPARRDFLQAQRIHRSPVLKSVSMSPKSPKSNGESSGPVDSQRSPLQSQSEEVDRRGEAAHFYHLSASSPALSTLLNPTSQDPNMHFLSHGSLCALGAEPAMSSVLRIRPNFTYMYCADEAGQLINNGSPSNFCLPTNALQGDASACQPSDSIGESASARESKAQKGSQGHAPVRFLRSLLDTVRLSGTVEAKDGSTDSSMTTRPTPAPSSNATLMGSAEAQEPGGLESQIDLQNPSRVSVQPRTGLDLHNSAKEKPSQIRTTKYSPQLESRVGRKAVTSSSAKKSAVEEVSQHHVGRKRSKKKTKKQSVQGNLSAVMSSPVLEAENFSKPMEKLRDIDTQDPMSRDQEFFFTTAENTRCLKNLDPCRREMVSLSVTPASQRSSSIKEQVSNIPIEEKKGGKDEGQYCSRVKDPPPLSALLLDEDLQRREERDKSRQSVSRERPPSSSDEFGGNWQQLDSPGPQETSESSIFKSSSPSTTHSRSLQLCSEQAGRKNTCQTHSLLSKTASWTSEEAKLVRDSDKSFLHDESKLRLGKYKSTSTKLGPNSCIPRKSIPGAALNGELEVNAAEPKHRSSRARKKEKHKIAKALKKEEEAAEKASMIARAVAAAERGEVNISRDLEGKNRARTLPTPGSQTRKSMPAEDDDVMLSVKDRISLENTDMMKSRKAKVISRAAPDRGSELTLNDNQEQDHERLQSKSETEASYHTAGGSCFPSPSDSTADFIPEGSSEIPVLLHCNPQTSDAYQFSPRRLTLPYQVEQPNRSPPTDHFAFGSVEPSEDVSHKNSTSFDLGDQIRSQSEAFYGHTRLDTITLCTSSSRADSGRRAHLKRDDSLRKGGSQAFGQTSSSNLLPRPTLQHEDWNWATKAPATLHRFESKAPALQKLDLQRNFPPRTAPDSTMTFFQGYGPVAGPGMTGSDHAEELKSDSPSASLVSLAASAEHREKLVRSRTALSRRHSPSDSQLALADENSDGDSTSKKVRWAGAHRSNRATREILTQRHDRTLYGCLAPVKKVRQTESQEDQSTFGDHSGSCTCDSSEPAPPSSPPPIFGDGNTEERMQRLKRTLDWRIKAAVPMPGSLVNAFENIDPDFDLVARQSSISPPISSFRLGSRRESDFEGTEFILTPQNSNWPNVMSPEGSEVVIERQGREKTLCSRMTITERAAGLDPQNIVNQESLRSRKNPWGQDSSRCMHVTRRQWLMKSVAALPDFDGVHPRRSMERRMRLHSLQWVDLELSIPKFCGRFRERRLTYYTHAALPSMPQPLGYTWNWNRPAIVFSKQNATHMKSPIQEAIAILESRSPRVSFTDSRQEDSSIPSDVRVALTTNLSHASNEGKVAPEEFLPWPSSPGYPFCHEVELSPPCSRPATPGRASGKSRVKGRTEESQSPLSSSASSSRESATLSSDRSSRGDVFDSDIDFQGSRDRSWAASLASLSTKERHAIEDFFAFTAAKWSLTSADSGDFPKSIAPVHFQDRMSDRENQSPGSLCQVPHQAASMFSQNELDDLELAMLEEESRSSPWRQRNGMQGRMIRQSNRSTYSHSFHGHLPGTLGPLSDVTTPASWRARQKFVPNHAFHQGLRNPAHAIATSRPSSVESRLQFAQLDFTSIPPAHSIQYVSEHNPIIMAQPNDQFLGSTQNNLADGHSGLRSDAVQFQQAQQEGDALQHKEWFEESIESQNRPDMHLVPDLNRNSGFERQHGQVSAVTVESGLSLSSPGEDSVQDAEVEAMDKLLDYTEPGMRGFTVPSAAGRESEQVQPPSHLGSKLPPPERLSLEDERQMQERAALEDLYRHAELDRKTGSLRVDLEGRGPKDGFAEIAGTNFSTTPGPTQEGKISSPSADSIPIQPPHIFLSEQGPPPGLAFPAGTSPISARNAQYGPGFTSGSVGAPNPDVSSSSHFSTDWRERYPSNHSFANHSSLLPPFFAGHGPVLNGSPNPTLLPGYFPAGVQASASPYFWSAFNQEMATRYRLSREEHLTYNWHLISQLSEKGFWGHGPYDGNTIAFHQQACPERLTYSVRQNFSTSSEYREPNSYEPRAAHEGQGLGPRFDRLNSHQPGTSGRGRNHRGRGRRFSSTVFLSRDGHHVRSDELSPKLPCPPSSPNKRSNSADSEKRATESDRLLEKSSSSAHGYPAFGRVSHSSFPAHHQGGNHNCNRVSRGRGGRGGPKTNHGGRGSGRGRGAFKGYQSLSGAPAQAQHHTL
ncbi:hypothetical protein IE53DRAFT_233716 [Violaceomyces palustris]|uniref:Uncharacterized protein n=1 Tax=Violaceomyces palustris TaxID=1673888 RepID=A0ACD0NPL0_9BASI|nr:hypothetical protein IE53DRAFT_233716 [Violaceomyces palustris]